MLFRLRYHYSTYVSYRFNQIILVQRLITRFIRDKGIFISEFTDFKSYKCCWIMF